MNIKNFLNKENISTLWDVISEEDNFKILNKNNQMEILQLFSNNIKDFFEKEKINSINLIELNKKFIVFILNFIKKKNSQNLPNKIKILEDQTNKELITYEEIQNDRKSKFEKDFKKVKENFTNSISLPIPELPEFKDKYIDTPIEEIDEMIKDMTLKRNYEVEQINRNYADIDINKVNNWLKPQETSIKSEKFTPNITNKKDLTTLSDNGAKLKHLNIDNIQNDNIQNDNKLNSPSSDSKKNVTWGENDIIETNILKNLKKIEQTNENERIYSKIIDNDRINNIENEIKMLNEKMDVIINLLKQDK
jgi:hypothetical protein